MRTLLFFVPSLAFGLVALVSSALAMDLGRQSSESELVTRNKAATWVAVSAAVLCALSLLAAFGILVLEATPGD